MRHIHRIVARSPDAQINRSRSDAGLWRDHRKHGEIARRQQLDHSLGRNQLGTGGGFFALEPFLRELARGLWIADHALVQAANSPIEPTL